MGHSLVDRWPFRYGSALGVGILLLPGMFTVGALQWYASGTLPVGSAYEGEYTFSEHCGACHGWYGEGNESGPTLLGTASSTPPDAERIEQSVRAGVGEMERVEGLDDQDLADVIAFLRSVRADSGF